jgi:hypothetical protein
MDLCRFASRVLQRRAETPLLQAILQPDAADFLDDPFLNLRRSLNHVVKFFGAFAEAADSYRVFVHPSIYRGHGNASGANARRGAFPRRFARSIVRLVYALGRARFEALPSVRSVQYVARCDRAGSDGSRKKGESAPGAHSPRRWEAGNYPRFWFRLP